MSKPVVLRPEADADVVDIWTLLHSHSPQTSARFLINLRSALDQISIWPEMYAVDWQNVRIAPVHKFKYLVYYIDQPAVVAVLAVLAVLHASRDASAWQSRV